MSLMNVSSTDPVAFPLASVEIFPKSPTWRSVSEGAPWSLPCGLTVSLSVFLFTQTNVAKLTVTTSACAAVGVVTENVNVHSTLGVRIVASDIP
jgi:hypothetical protein